MTNEELALRIKNGETDLIEELWLQNRGLIAIKARRYIPSDGSTSKFDIKDLFQDAYFALLAAVKAYDPDSEYKFASFLGYHLRNAFAQEIGIRSSNKHALYVVISLDAPLLGSQDDSLTLVDSITDETAEQKYDDLIDGIVIEHDFEIVIKAMQKLEPNQRDIIIDHYVNKQVLEKIAARYGLSKERIRQIEEKGLLKLRKTRAVSKLIRDRQIEREIDRRSNFYGRKGVANYQSSGTSAVEDLVEKRDVWRKKSDREKEQRRKDHERVVKYLDDLSKFISRMELKSSNAN